MQMSRPIDALIRLPRRCATPKTPETPSACQCPNGSRARGSQRQNGRPACALGCLGDPGPPITPLSSHREACRPALGEKKRSWPRRFVAFWPDAPSIHLGRNEPQVLFFFSLVPGFLSPASPQTQHLPPLTATAALGQFQAAVLRAAPCSAKIRNHKQQQPLHLPRRVSLFFSSTPVTLLLCVPILTLGGQEISSRKTITEENAQQQSARPSFILHDIATCVPRFAKRVEQG